MFLGKCLREDQRETAGRREEKEKEGGPAGNRWTQGEEGEGGRTSGKPLDAGRGKGRREEGGELTLTNTIIKKKRRDYD